MNLTVSIESAENRFKRILEEFFVSIYDEDSLPSHGIDHHRRVWSYAKEIIMIMAKLNKTVDHHLPHKLILVCYLHDIGMSVDPGIIHGNHSRNLCIRFLENNHLDKNDFTDVLFAIENHDDKEYKSSSVSSDILKILSVADDLDAFGFTGIYRYSEIYLARGIKPSEIGDLIRENARKRFENLVKTFGYAELLIHKHRKRYEILDNFFSEYNKQVGSCNFTVKHQSGYCGVMEILMDAIIKKSVLKEVCRDNVKFPNDKLIRWFFEGLLTELD
jgi:HD superfamily phosphodiesterase